MSSQSHDASHLSGPPYSGSQANQGETLVSTENRSTSLKRKRNEASAELGEVESGGLSDAPDQECLRRHTDLYDRMVPTSFREAFTWLPNDHQPKDDPATGDKNNDSSLQSEVATEPFNILSALLRYPALTLEFSTHLPVDDLIALYAISKDFHYIVNTKFTSVVLGQSSTKAPESSRTFLFTYYKRLCLRDPIRTQLRSMTGIIRMIPSFQWLRMILFREEVVEDILRHLYIRGHRLPPAATLVLKKMWFTLDFSTNQSRIMLMHNDRFWTNEDLRIATMFFIKLDLRLTDPMAGRGFTSMRRMLLNQRSLSTLARVLQRDQMDGHIDALRMLVKYNYTPLRAPQHSIFGVPAEEVGKLQYEGWGWGTIKFIPIEILVCREAIRRGLHFRDEYLDMVLHGYIRDQSSAFAAEQWNGRELGQTGGVSDYNREPFDFDLSGDHHLVFQDSEGSDSSPSVDSSDDDDDDDNDDGDDDSDGDNESSISCE